jgi:hypothetical protein
MAQGFPVQKAEDTGAFFNTQHQAAWGGATDIQRHTPRKSSKVFTHLRW